MEESLQMHGDERKKKKKDRREGGRGVVIMEVGHDLIAASSFQSGSLENGKNKKETKSKMISSLNQYFSEQILFD